MAYKINYKEPKVEPVVEPQVKAQDEGVIVIPDIREAMRLDITDAEANKILMEIRTRLKEQKVRAEKGEAEKKARAERLTHNEEAVKFFAETLQELGYTSIVRMKYASSETKRPMVRGTVPLEQFDGQTYKDSIMKKLKPKLRTIGYLPEDIEFTAQPNKQEVYVSLEVKKV